MQRIERVHVTTAGGARHDVVAVMLYPSPRVTEAIVLRAEAEAKLADQLGWTAVPRTLPFELGGAILAALVDEGASLGRAKAGLELLRRSEDALEAARRHGRFFGVADVERGRLPAPNLWVAEAAHEATRRGLLGGTSTEHTTTRFLHDGSPFVRVKHEGGAVSFVSWETVADWAPDWEVPKADDDD